MIYVISKATFGSYNVRDIQCNANWDCCPYSDYALIPDSMVEGILATKGYCDITLNSAGTEVASFTARTIPSVEEECCGTNTVLSVNGKTANTAGEVSLAASDFTSGLLPLERGGTNRDLSGIEPYSIIRAASNSAYLLSTPTANGAFYATAANGAAKFGTLPIAQGGTGATDRLAAAKNLTNEAVSSPNYVVSLTGSWANFGYTTLAQLRTAMGIKDYVTAQGTSGNWHYRKYNSGYCECWRTIAEQVTASQWEAWGGIYLTPGISVGAFPFSIYSAVPNVTAHNAGNNTLGVVTASDVSATTMNEVRCFRGTKPGSTISVVYNIFVCGKWKE